MSFPYTYNAIPLHIQRQEKTGAVSLQHPRNPCPDRQQHKKYSELIDNEFSTPTTHLFYMSFHVDGPHDPEKNACAVSLEYHIAKHNNTNTMTSSHPNHDGIENFDFFSARENAMINGSGISYPLCII